MTPYYNEDGITIYHGDCNDVLPLVDPADVSLLLTDPPYGINHKTDYRRFTGGAESRRSMFPRIEGDNEPFDPAPFESFRRRILWGANSYSDKLPKGSWLVWDKRSPSGSKNVMSDAEVAWDSHGNGVYVFSHFWDGFNRETERGTAYHPTQKPVALMRWVLERASEPGDLVFDPYMGSGPIAQACHEMGRRYIGVEIVEEYCQRAVDRLAQGVLAL